MLLLAWAICASSFTLVIFEFGSFWKAVHLFTVYVGAVFFAIAAIAGGMFLYRDHQLRSKATVGEQRPFASLERIETIMIRSSAVAFAMLTLTVAMGAIDASSRAEPVSVKTWVKIVLAAVIWAIYAIVMNVQRATMFRGRRAAWLSIAAMALILATFGVAVGPDKQAEQPNDNAQRLSDKEVG